jgi:hypothetical protein
MGVAAPVVPGAISSIDYGKLTGAVGPLNGAG